MFELAIQYICILCAHSALDLALKAVQMCSMYYCMYVQGIYIQQSMQVELSKYSGSSIYTIMHFKMSTLVIHFSCM